VKGGWERKGTTNVRLESANIKRITAVSIEPDGAVVEITGENAWEYDTSTPVKDMYQVEHDELFASIRSGFPINDGIRMANSTMMAIMGRMAAYTGQEVTWDQAINSQERLVPEQLDWNMKLPIQPMAIPGKTKLI
jgi:hypothetical protein